MSPYQTKMNFTNSGMTDHTKNILTLTQLQTILEIILEQLDSTR